MRWIISRHRNHLCVSADVTECALVRQRQHLGAPPFLKGSRWNALFRPRQWLQCQPSLHLKLSTSTTASKTRPAFNWAFRLDFDKCQAITASRSQGRNKALICIDHWEVQRSLNLGILHIFPTDHWHLKARSGRHWWSLATSRPCGQQWPEQMNGGTTLQQELAHRFKWPETKPNRFFNKPGNIHCQDLSRFPICGSVDPTQLKQAHRNFVFSFAPPLHSTSLSESFCDRYLFDLICLPCRILPWHRKYYHSPTIDSNAMPQFMEYTACLISKWGCTASTGFCM